MWLSVSPGPCRAETGCVCGKCGSRMAAAGRISCDSSTLGKNSGLVVASFTNGQLKPSKHKSIRFRCFDSSNEKDNSVLVAETDRLRYSSPTTKSEEPCKYAIAVRNRENGKIRLYSTEMFKLQPDFKDKTDEVDSNPSLTFREKSDRLVRAFGGAKMKRVMESRLRNKTNDQSLHEAVGTAAQQALESVPTVTAPPSPSVSSAIPPHNTTALKPDEAYKLEDIITSNELEAMKGPAQVFVKCEKSDITKWKEAQIYPEYILHKLQSLPIAPDTRLHRSCCLMYLNYLIHLYKLRANELKRKGVLPDDTPDVVNKSILHRFTLISVGPRGTNVRCMPARLKDTLLAYMLVLCLHIDQFNLEYSNLMKDLKIGGRKMMTNLRSLGCKVSFGKVSTSVLTPGTSCLATLPLPLTFQDLTIRSRKQKR